MSLPYRYQHMGQTWKFTAGSDKAKVSFKIFDGQSSGCRDQEPWSADGYCIRDREYSVPISSLKALGGRVPRNYVEAEALTREFNSKVEFRSSAGPINGSRATDFSMVARDAFQ
ncbi:hypothetical protein D3C72_1114640 [compost metagenome]